MSLFNLVQPPFSLSSVLLGEIWERDSILEAYFEDCVLRFSFQSFVSKFVSLFLIFSIMFSYNNLVFQATMSG